MGGGVSSHVASEVKRRISNVGIPFLTDSVAPVATFYINNVVVITEDEDKIRCVSFFRQLNLAPLLDITSLFFSGARTGRHGI
jgi:hypothetical protein